jgi:catechol 2,3-dioxygenase-like lactoylglutathione lyase family enzyme
MFPPPLAILETCLYVDDLAEAERFYSAVLGLEFYSRQADRHVFFRCGCQMLLLFDAQATSGDSCSLPPHGTTGPGHVAFAARECDLDAWRERLALHHVPLEKVVSWPEGGKSLYFRDPAGNSVEIASPRLWGLPQPCSE